ncbi:hypothetical protein BgiMline_011588, partial [Biomphalaria glabrata]
TTPLSYISFLVPLGPRRGLLSMSWPIANISTQSGSVSRLGPMQIFIAPCLNMAALSHSNMAAAHSLIPVFRGALP